MENKHKALIGLGIVTVVAVGYYFHSKKSEVKKAEPETKNTEEKAADTSVSASQPKKELNPEEAKRIAQKNQGLNPDIKKLNYNKITNPSINRNMKIKIT